MLAKSKGISRKAQTATSAGVLVGLIALLIIMYILFLPPEVRQDLLTENETSSSAGGTSQELKTLLDEKPGRLEPSSVYEKYADGHTVGDLTVKVSRNAAVIKTINPFYIKNNIFGTISKQTTFEIKNLETVDNIMLSFAVSSHQGRLIVKLNGKEIFNSEVKSYNPSPIQISKDELVEGTNTLEFSVSGPGIAFWRENYYEVSDIKITGYITDLAYQKSSSSFQISEFEIENAEKYYIRFYADCASSNRGQLTVYINGQELTTILPDCGSQQSIEVSTNYFSAGQNKITFSTDAGLYSVQQIRVIPQFKEIKYPIYYFNLESSQYEKVKKGNAKVRLSLNFPDDSEKTFNLRINNILKRVNTRNTKYELNISSDVVEGNNAIKLEPVSTVDISELKVEYYSS